MARTYDRILVIARPSIGDVLLATPLIRALHERWPQAPLDVYASIHNPGPLLKFAIAARTATVALTPLRGVPRSHRQRRAPLVCGML